ncbi:MAG: methyltransferase domain-containing protein [Dehalococcoidia bacterium]
MSPELDVNACCTASYSHPLARWLLGNSFHPGGLALTTRLAHLSGVKPMSRLLDVGSGGGASAVHLAKTIGCQVVGVTLEKDGTAAGYTLARKEGVEDQVTFIEGDIQEVELEAESFHVVLMECVLSILPGKAAVLRRLYGLLRPGGHLGLTDVTVNGTLTPELRGVLAVAGCVGDARPLEEYLALVEAQGFTIDQSQYLQETVSAFLRNITGRLLVVEAASKLGRLPVGDDVITAGKRVLAVVQELVLQGILSYGLVVAKKPA